MESSVFGLSLPMFSQVPVSTGEPMLKTTPSATFTLPPKMLSLLKLNVAAPSMLTSAVPLCRSVISGSPTCTPSAESVRSCTFSTALPPTWMPFGLTSTRSPPPVWFNVPRISESCVPVT